MVRLLNYILAEDVADKAEELATKLRQVYRVAPRDIRQLWAQAGEDYDQFYALLQGRDEEEAAKAQEIEPENIESLSGEDVFTTDKAEVRRIGRGVEYQEPEKGVKDEAVIKLLEYLAHIWGNRDAVRVIAARFDIDPDLYQMAGLGRLPDDYTDEDVWDTMDMSNQGKEPFYNAAWQPFYIKALEKLQNLSSKRKDEIKNIIQQQEETKRNIYFPVGSGEEERFQDVGVAYENKEDMVVETKAGLMIIPVGTRIELVRI